MIKTSAPGSMLMFGEHSVLRGAHAIFFAINKRIYIELQPRSDDTINISSPLGQVTVCLDNIIVKPPFQYVLQAIKEFPPSTGLDIAITSEMSPTMGFGTSAAVVVGLISALNILSGKSLDTLFEQSLLVVRAVQGLGSGADIMASINGGIGLFRNDTYAPLTTSLKFFATYYGKKVPTPEVVKHVEERFLHHAELLQKLDEANDALVLEATKYLDDAKKLGNLFNLGAGIMEAFGVHTKDIENFLWELREQSHGVKLSGSGLGDCALGIVKNGVYPKNSFTIEISEQGIVFNKL